MLRDYVLIPFFVRLRPRSFLDLSKITPKMVNTTKIETEWEDMIKKFGLCE